MAVRPTHDQVLSLAPDAAAATAALPLASPGVWSAAGCDDGAIWGQYVATSAEPYSVAVDLSDDLAGPAFRCNCPSRKIPCKHALGLLLLHATGGIAVARRLPFAAAWLQRRAQAQARAAAAEVTAAPVEQPRTTHDGDETGHAGDLTARAGIGTTISPQLDADPPRDARTNERADRMRAGLQELDRWLADRIRVGLAAAELADPATWDRVAGRLVDAQCGSLANRVRRVAAKVGQSATWHEDVLEEMALLHVLAVGAQRCSVLPDDLADGVHAATGLAVARDDVLAGVPSTTRWIVAGESRVREDRITVQRTWLASAPHRGGGAGRAAVTWAMVLAFGAFGNEVVTEHHVGTAFTGDVHWYPGATPLRGIVGRIHSDIAAASTGPQPTTIADALCCYGSVLAREPWLERYPMSFCAVPAPLGNGRWALSDVTGAVPIVAPFARMADVVCVSAGRPVHVMGEWSAEGFAPLTLFAADQAVVL